MTNKLHHTLTRQLHKLGLDEQRLPDAQVWIKFLNLIEKAYHDADIERVVLDRSLAISSDEMQSVYLREKSNYEARLRALFNSSQDLIWLKDPEGVYLACNPMFERFFGASAAQIVGKSDYDFVDRALADFFLSHDRAVIEKQQPCSNEEWLTFADNQYRGLFETVKTPIFDDAGQLMGVMGVARDISERERIADSIKAHEQQLSYVLEATGEGVWDWDIKSGVFSHNGEWCTMAGIDDGYLSHALEVFAEVLHEDDRELVFEKIYTALAGDGTYHSEHRFRRANDEIVWVLDRGKVVERDESGVPVRMVGSAVDITHRKSIENKLLREIRKSEGLLKAASDGLHIMDAKGNLVQVSDSFCRMLGYRREEILGMNVMQWDVRVQSVQEFEEKLHQLPPNGLVFETQQRRRDGKIIDVELSAVYVAIGEERFVYSSAQDISERKSAERLLIDREAKLAAILDNLPFMIWLKNVSGQYVAVNKPYVRAAGKSNIDEVVGKTDFDLWPHELAEKFVSDDALVMASRQQQTFEENSFDYGQDAWVETYKSPIIDSGGRLLGTTGLARDITQRKQEEEALKIAALVYQVSSEAMLVTDANNNIVDVNPAFTRITGYAYGEVIGKNPRVFQSGMHDETFYRAMWADLLANDYWQGEIWDRRKNGEAYPKLLTINTIRDDSGEVARHVALFSDISEKKKSEEMIWRQANFDMLTGLPNRRLLMDRLASALSLSTRNANYGALLFIDMDKFKMLNDTLGHDYGDLLLVEVAARARSCVREIDTVARFGGDEFVILIEDVDVKAEVASHKISQVAEKIREALAQPYHLKGIEYHSSPSIGVSLYLGDEHTVDEVMKHSDLAMYQAKDSGRNAVRFFDPEIQRSVENRVIIEADLRRAVTEHQLCLYYQIQVDNHHRPLGAEALVRWMHPVRGMVSPAQFIPVAEESSLIIEIGHWVLITACQQLAAWAKDEITMHLKLAVNVSAKQFRQHDFVAQVASALREYGVEPDSLKLELTESVVLTDVTDVVEKMHALKALGVRLSLDDFGTGYSSLAYLKNLPLDQIKIDQSFVRDITTDQNDAVMVKTIIDLAHNFRLNVIAEGVETESQLDFLKKNNCMSYQGYLFSRPVPIAQFDALLKRGRGGLDFAKE